MSSFDWQAEVIKAILNVIVAVITLGLGWFVGHRLTVYWAIRQKQRELELSALNDFYNLYGEFFAIWKLWAYCNAPDEDMKLSDTTRWSLLERACIAEGKLEAIFVMLSSERTLKDHDIETLGKFRQAYQQLRESIRDNKDLGWWSQDHPEYLSFKHLAYLTACIILSGRSRERKGEVLTKITSNSWEKTWILDDDDWKRLQAHYI